MKSSNFIFCFVTREQLFHLALFPGMNAETDRTERRSGNNGKKKKHLFLTLMLQKTKEKGENSQLCFNKNKKRKVELNNESTAEN